MGTPDKGIPEELLDSAKCVAVIPSMIKIGFVFGGRHGRGIAVCRTKFRMERACALSLSPEVVGDSRSAEKRLTWSCW